MRAAASATAQVLAASHTATGTRRAALEAAATHAEYATLLAEAEANVGLLLDAVPRLRASVDGIAACLR